MSIATWTTEDSDALYRVSGRRGAISGDRGSEPEPAA
jgi:hypothetical protein